LNLPLPRAAIDRQTSTVKEGMVSNHALFFSSSESNAASLTRTGLMN
jgi:hypothetical protein